MPVIGVFPRTKLNVGFVEDVTDRWPLFAGIVDYE